MVPSSVSANNAKESSSLVVGSCKDFCSLTTSSSGRKKRLPHHVAVELQEGACRIMRHHTVLEYARYRYLKIATLVVLAAILAFAWYKFPVGRYGGTAVGYTLGTVGALLIVWLMWLGVQKRRYRANAGNLQGWLSAHIYLGTTLVVIATLHTGFQVGWNVHTLAYVLMLAVIFSGFFGVFAYLRFPARMTENMAEDTLDGLVMKIADLDREIRKVSLSMSDEINAVAIASVKNTQIGGGLWAQLAHRPGNCPTKRAVVYLEQAAKTLKDAEQRQNHVLFSLLLRKQKLLARARADVRFKALLDLWLYIHVPLSFALLGALTAHIVSVFFYW
jgi:hypothetical protein